MALFEWYDRGIQKFKWYDMGLFKFAMFLFTLFLITAWPGLKNFLLGIKWYWYFILFVICAIPLMKKMFGK